MIWTGLIIIRKIEGENNKQPANCKLVIYSEGLFNIDQK
jgi:hypothetical protein